MVSYNELRCLVEITKEKHLQLCTPIAAGVLDNEKRSHDFLTLRQTHSNKLLLSRAKIINIIIRLH